MLKVISVQEALTRKTSSKGRDIEVFLTWLKNNPPEKDSIFQVSRHVASLLLLASGRRIHDLTLLSINSENCIIENDSIIFWPIYGSKTDSFRYRQSGWKLTKSSVLEYDLVKWIKCLIELSRTRRGPNLVHLFITTRGKVKPASRTTIAGWIKTILLKIGISFSPGSIRSAVGSYHFDKDVELDTILARGNWRGKENFFKHYCKTVERPKGLASNSVLNLFEPL